MYIIVPMGIEMLMELYAFYAFHLWDGFLYGCLDAVFQCGESVRAGAAVTLQAHHNHAFIGHIDIFHVAAILLQVRAYLLQCVLDFTLYNDFFFVGHRLLFFLRDWVWLVFAVDY